MCRMVQAEVLPAIKATITKLALDEILRELIADLNAQKK